MPSKKSTPSVFVRGLPYTCTREQLSAHFSAVAPVRHAIVVCDSKTHESKGFGFVQFAFEEDARLSCEKLNGSTIDGRRIQVEVASAEKHQPDDREARRSRPRPSDAPGRSFAPTDAAASAVPADDGGAEREGKKKRLRGDDESDLRVPGSDVAEAVAPPAPPAPSVASKKKKKKLRSGDAAVSSPPAAAALELPDALPISHPEEPVPATAAAPKLKRPRAAAPPPPPEVEEAPDVDSSALDEQPDTESAADAAAPAPPSAEVPFARKSAFAALTRERTLHLFGLPADFDKKRLWKRARKIRGAADLAFPVTLPGNTRCCIATLSFPSRLLRDKACARLDGHALLGHTLSARGGEALLARRDAFTQGRLIVRNLRFDATPQHLLNAALRSAGAATAAAVVHIHVPVKPGSPLPPPASLAVAVACGPAAVPKRTSGAKAAAAASSGELDSDSDSPSAGEGDVGAAEGGAGEEADASDAEDADSADGDSDNAGGGKEEPKAAAVGPKYRNRGFAFLEFATHAAAAAALAAMNGCRVHRRQVAVDWVLSKEDYAAAADTAATVAASAQADEGGEDDGPTEVAEGGAADEVGEEPAADEEGEEGEGDEENAEEEADADEEDDADAAAAAPGGSKADSVEAGTTLFIQNLPFDATSTQLRDALAVFGGVRYAQVVMDRERARSKGTGFVQFYKADAAERALAASALGPEAESAAERYSEATEAGGTDGADVQAARQRYANAVLTCIRAGGVILGGRVLAIKSAVKKDEAEKLAEEGDEKRAKKRFDRRHTHLAYEGNVRAGSDVASAMPASDLAKREAAAKEKKEKLKSPLFFVSPLRLSIRNLARSVDDAALRLLCIKATTAGLKARLVKPGEGDPDLMPPKGTPPAERIALKSSRVMREGAGGRDEGGAPRSKGFAFVEFTSHLHALTCLRQLNNNPAYSHLALGGAAARSKPENERPRLIVEFVLENLAKKRLHEQKVAERREREGILTASGVVRRPKTAGSAGSAPGAPPEARPPKAAFSAPPAAPNPRHDGAGKRKRESDGQAEPRFERGPRSGASLRDSKGGSGPRSSVLTRTKAPEPDPDAGIMRALAPDSLRRASGSGERDAPVAGGARREGRKRLQEEDARHEALVSRYTRSLAERHAGSGGGGRASRPGAGLAAAASGSNAVDTGGRLAARRVAAATLFGAAGTVDPKWME